MKKQKIGKKYIPIEILISIFTFLSLKDLLSQTTICRQWYNIINQYGWIWKTLGKSSLKIKIIKNKKAFKDIWIYLHNPIITKRRPTVCYKMLKFGSNDETILIEFHTWEDDKKKLKKANIYKKITPLKRLRFNFPIWNNEYSLGFYNAGGFSFDDIMKNFFIVMKKAFVYNIDTRKEGIWDKLNYTSVDFLKNPNCGWCVHLETNKCPSILVAKNNIYFEVLST
jgi:hypothetical protein